jgi:uncharacterized protein YxjI
LRGRRGDGGTKYRMREKMFAIGDDFWIENEQGERAFKVNGKALRIRATLALEDPPGTSCSRCRRSCAFATRWRSSAAVARSRPSRRR